MANVSEREPGLIEPGTTTDVVMTKRGIGGARSVAGASTFEVLAGLGAIVLAIIGLTGFLPLDMTAIATIAIGAALLAEGGAVARRWRAVLDRFGFERTEVEAGARSEILGGLAAVVLGILALAHVVPLALLPIAAIVLGGAMLFGGPMQADIQNGAQTSVAARERVMALDIVRASSGGMVLAGLAAAVLGILALISVGPVLTLSMVAMLVIGAAVLTSGSAMTARLSSHLR